MNFLPEDPPPTGAPEWLLTYGDLMSLLLAFFVMLVAMSDLQSEGRVAQAVEAMHRQFGHDSPTADGYERHQGAKVAAPSGLHSLARPLGAARTAVVGGAIGFEEDSAALGETEQEQLRLLAERLQGKGQKIEIRGHTSRRPLTDGGPFRDHWELAFARCRAVEQVLVAAGIEAKRLRLSVAGGNEPAYVGDEHHRKRENSRVEVFLLDEFAGPNGGDNSPSAAP